MDVQPGTVVHAAIQDQLRAGTLQPGQGASAAAGTGAEAPPLVPEPAPAAPEPATVSDRPPDQQETLLTREALGRTSPRADTGQSARDIQFEDGSRSTVEQATEAQQRLAPPVQRPDYPMRDFIKSIVSETLAEQGQGRR